MGRTHPPGRNEKEILGFFISGHPLEKYRDKLEDLRALSTEEISWLWANTPLGKDENITTAGIITNLRVLKSKRGDFYAQGALEDMAGSVEMLVFPEAYRKLQEKVKLEVPVLIRGGVRIEEGANPKLTVNDIMPLRRRQGPIAEFAPHPCPAGNPRMSPRWTPCTPFAPWGKGEPPRCYLMWNAREISW